MRITRRTNVLISRRELRVFAVVEHIVLRAIAAGSRRTWVVVCYVLVGGKKFVKVAIALEVAAVLCAGTYLFCPFVELHWRWHQKN